MLDAALFEPGEWQPAAAVKEVKEVPMAQRDVFATDAGLLMNELQFAPEGLLSHVLELARNVLDLDIGRYKPRQRHRSVGDSTSTPSGGSVAILYVLRLIVRVEGFVVLFTEGKSATAARGTACEDVELKNRLRKVLRSLRSILWDRFMPTLERWCNAALKERDTATACVLLAHLAFLCRNTPAAQLDYRQVSTH